MGVGFGGAGKVKGVGLKKEKILNSDSLENGKADEGGGAGEREIIWKRREGVVVQEEVVGEPEREYTVWKKREGFKEKRAREESLRSQRSLVHVVGPEVVWRRREGLAESDRERPQANPKDQEAIWRKRERD